MKFLYFSVTITFFFLAFTLSEYSGFQTVHFSNPIVYIFLLLVASSLIIKIKQKHNFIYKNKLFLFISLCCFVVTPIFTFNVGNFNFLNNFKNVFYTAIFLGSIFMISNLIITRKDYIKLVRAIFLGNSLYILPMLAINLNDLFNLNHYLWLFGDERLERATYGLRHPNFSGMILLVEFYCLVILIIYERSKKNVLYLMMPLIVCFIAIISTGNRAAFFAVLISLIIVSFYYLISLFPKIIKYFLITTIILVSITYFIWIFNWNEFYNNSLSLIERFNTINSLMNLIPIYGDFITGIAPINQIELDSKILFLRTDNWYIQNIALYGLLAVIIFLCWIIFFATSIIRQQDSKNSFIRLSILFSALVYALMENSLISYGYSWSLFTWIILLSTFEKKARYE
ncbi:hypothetical protein RIF24_14200 [Exiguobacterium acetylicum]|uniref:hypothetical protein n=1 Tax=Exiguobacterium acetylicum TaxID=41170 RepID=UPI00397757D2